MDRTWFPLPPGRPADQLHPLALAYIGDAVYEVYIRQYLLSKRNHRPSHLHREATRYVAARSQAKMLAAWLPELTEEEREVVRRGLGAKSGTAPKSADMIEYRRSTAFECLIGHLYYTGRHERLNGLLERAVRYMEEE